MSYFEGTLSGQAYISFDRRHGNDLRHVKKNCRAAFRGAKTAKLGGKSKLAELGTASPEVKRALETARIPELNKVLMGPVEAQVIAECVPLDTIPLAGSAAQQTLRKETYTHRIIATMKASGHSVDEIAKEVGQSTSTVRNALKQPWTQQHALDLVEANGAAKVEQFFAEKALPAAEKLAEIMDDPTASTRDQLAAANAILNRNFGMPNQPLSVTNKQTPIDKMTLEEVQANLATLRAKKNN